MDEEQVKTLFTTLMSEFKADLVSTIDSKNSGLAASLTKKFDKAIAPKEVVPEENEQKLTMKALQQQLLDMTKTLEDEKKAAFNSASESALVKTIADSGAQNTSALRKLLLSEYSGKLKSENGDFFVTNGDDVTPLSQAVNSYLSTEEGKYFIPPSGVKGSGSVESKQTTSSSTEKQSSADALFASFSDY